MAKEQPPLTDEEKYELALQSEAELARLARTYTIMERSRAEFMQAGCSKKLAKQKRVLDLFKREQANIWTDLAVASTGSRVKKGKQITRKLSNLLVEYDDFDNEIKTERNYIKEIEDQIQMVKKKLLEMAAKQISDDKYQQRVLKGEKTVQTLENKLEVQIKKFCVICAENVALRSQLHHLLNERHEFNKIWDRLIRNLCIGKKFMIDLIEQATIAYDQREEWVSKLQILRTKAHNELVAHIQEMREQQRKSDNDVKLQEFFATKGQKRIMKDLEDIQMKKRQRRKAKIQVDLERYLNLLIEIKEFSQQDCVPDIAREFLFQEEENFAMFKYVNNLNRQMEELSDSLTICYNKIDDQKAIHEIRRLQQESALKELEKCIEDDKIIEKQKEAELKAVEAKLSSALAGIGTLFKLFRCNNDPLISMLGHNETIHYYNALPYLEILEKKIHESFITVYYKEKHVGKKKKGAKSDQFIVRQDRTSEIILPIEMICRTNPCPLCIEHDLVSDVIDQLQFAYTKEEIQQKLKTRLHVEGSQAALHNVSACHLPKSRQIIQKRYQ